MSDKIPPSAMDRFRDLVTHEIRSQRHIVKSRIKGESESDEHANVDSGKNREDLVRAWRKREQIAGLFQKYSRHLSTLESWEQMENESGFKSLVDLLRLSGGSTSQPSLLIGKRCTGTIAVLSSMGT